MLAVQRSDRVAILSLADAIVSWLPTCAAVAFRSTEAVRASCTPDGTKEGSAGTSNWDCHALSASCGHESAQVVEKLYRQERISFLVNQER